MENNKYIDLCGLGNALVDLLFEIDDKELSNLQLKKGEMRLVSIEEQESLLKKLEGRNHNKCSGGSAGNTIITFTNFGGKSAYKTVLGNDDFGRFYEDDFNQMAIELASSKIDGLPTGTCIVLISPDSERTMHTCLGAAAKFNPSHLKEDYIKNAKWLYIEGFKFSEQSSTEAIFKAVEIAKNYNTKIALTFSDYFITETFRENLKKVAEASDLIFCNENEAISFTQTDNIQSALELMNSKFSNFCITMGAQGAIVSWEGEIIRVPAYETKAIDSTGAGDNFAGAFLWGIIYTNNPELAGHLASLSASRVVSQFGARLKEGYNEIKNTILNKFK